MAGTGPAGGASASPAHRLLRAAESAINTIALISAALVFLGLVVMAIAVFYRYFLGTPVNWADELTGYLVVGLVMAGFGSALLLDQHIGVDLLTGMAPPRARRWLGVWSGACVLLCGAMFTWSAWHAVAFNRDFGVYSTGAMQVPIWIVQAPMILGGALLCLAAIIRAIRALTDEVPL